MGRAHLPVHSKQYKSTDPLNAPNSRCCKKKWTSMPKVHVLARAENILPHLRRVKWSSLGKTVALRRLTRTCHTLVKSFPIPHPSPYFTLQVSTATSTKSVDFPLWYSFANTATELTLATAWPITVHEYW